MTDSNGPAAGQDATGADDGRASSPPRIGIVGLGLIGGSLARDLAAAGWTVLAADSHAGSLDAAAEEGVVSDTLDPAAPPDTVVLAVPVRAAPGWIRRLAAADSPPTVVTDTGSTKRSTLRAARDAGLEGFVGSHPVAGSHESGWSASRTGLFRDAVVWICPPADPDSVAPTPPAAPRRPGTPPDAGGPPATGRERDRAVAAVERLWRAVGARPRRITAADHDRLLARTSHLPQATATALGLALDRLGVLSHQLGPGGLDTSRLAASDPAMWTDILLDNADQVTPALDALAAELDRLSRAIADHDEVALRTTLARARSWKTPP